MVRSIAGGVALVALVATSAAAAPATPEEAQRLTTLLERYVGHTEGHPSVTVTPHGEAYTASFDVGHMLSFLAPLGMEVTTGEAVAELQPQDDGRWHVTVAGLPPVGINASGQATSITWNGYAFDGLFDPKIEAFATATTTTGGSTSHSFGKQGTSEARMVDVGTSRITSVAASAPGKVDVDMHSSLKDVDYRLSVTPNAAPGGGAAPPPQAISVAIATVETSLAVKDQPSVALNALWQFLVAHPSKAALVASQAELKSRLKAVVPLASTLSGDLAVTKIKAETALGAFGLDSMTERYGAGAGPGTVAATITMAGLSLPDGLLPPWSVNLLPSSLDVSQTYGPVNITPALDMLIDDLDLAADKPLTDAQKSALLQALGGDDFVLHISHSTIATPTITLKLEGEARMTKPLPTGSATVTATGLDKTIAAIRAAGANDPTAQQAIVLLMAAKGVAKAEGPDSYSWQIEAPPGGQLTVNGNALAALSGGGDGTAPRPKPRKPQKLTP